MGTWKRIPHCWCLLAGVVGVAMLASLAPHVSRAGDAETMPARTPQRAYTSFQWALYTDGTLLLAPRDETYYYPAEHAGEGVIETRPVQIKVAFHRNIGGDSNRTAVNLRSVRSPREVQPERWVMEYRNSDGSWSPAETFHFHGMQFYALKTPGKFTHVKRENVRFRRR